MRNKLIFLAAGILIGVLAGSVYFGKTAEHYGRTGGAVDGPAQHAAAVPSDPPPQQKPREAGDAHATPGPKPTSAKSPEKVAAVREAYRRILEEQDSSSPDDGNQFPRAQDGTLPSISVQPQPTEAALPGSTGSPNGPAFVDQPRLWLPAAMLEPDESIAITSELQVSEWEQLQEEFVQAVDGRAPSNETEREAWIRAQQENDDLFRAKFGWDAFRQQQLKAYMEGLAPAPPR